MNCSRTNEEKKKKKTNHRAKEKKICLFLSDCPDEIFFSNDVTGKIFSKQVN